MSQKTKDLPVAKCQVCHCTEEKRCPIGCYWVWLNIPTGYELCSECARGIAWGSLHVTAGVKCLPPRVFVGMAGR